MPRWTLRHRGAALGTIIETERDMWHLCGTFTATRACDASIESMFAKKAMRDATRVLMRLGRELRYRPLPIIGTRVVIETLVDVGHVLRQLVTPWITRMSEWDGCDVEMGLAKYGLLDRWCHVEASQLDGAMAGIAALRANGFARGRPDPDPAIEAQVRQLAAGCLADLAESLGACVLKVFLNDGLSNELRFRQNADRYRARLAPELLPDYFPRPFR